MKNSATATTKHDRNAEEKAERKTVPFQQLVEYADGDECFTANAQRIVEILDLYRHDNKAIGSAWAIKRVYCCGGLLIHLIPEYTRDNGNICIVDYSGDRGDYGIVYGINTEAEITIIEERDLIEVDQLAERFAEITGIQIPAASFD